jgi:TusA-related sulfurtransferase
VSQEIDARGLDCPHPVILTRKALLETELRNVRVLVDTDVQAHNCQRAAEKLGWMARVAPSDDGFAVTLQRP